MKHIEKGIIVPFLKPILYEIANRFSFLQFQFCNDLAIWTPEQKI